MNSLTTVDTSRSPAKAMLLCAHSRELSLQCTTAIRSGAMDQVLQLQARKHIIVEELAAILKELDLATLPDLNKAMEQLRETLRSEMRTLAEASNSVKNDLAEVHNSQRRLSSARRYNAVEESGIAPLGGRLFACG